jgi:hypothetical protein
MKIEGKCAYGYYRIYIHYIVVACVVKMNSVSVDHQNIIQIRFKARERSKVAESC